jgi:hypothetical protein
VRIPSLPPKWAKDKLWAKAREVPSLDLRFAENKSLVDATTGAQLVTFTRASSGTYVDSTGTIRTATTNEARFDHNPVTSESLGLLVEEQRTNLLLQSEDFSTTWATISASLSTNTTTAPDGTLTADTVTASSSTGGRVQQNVSFTGDGDKAVSVWLKAGTAPSSRIRIDDSTAGFVNRILLTVTWTNGVASVVADNGTLQGVDAFPNGWYRIRGLAVGVVAANTNRYRIEADSTNGTGSVIAWGAQAENGTFTTSYIPTGASAVTRSADVASITDGPSGSNLTSWLNVNEGSFFAEAQSFQTTATANFAFAISDGTLNNRIDLNVRAGSLGGASRGIVQSGGSTSFDTGNIATPAFTPNLVYRQAIGYQLDNFVHVFNGNTPKTDVSGAVPVAMTILDIGSRASSSLFLNGHIRRLTFWPTRLANSTHQSITQ